MTSTRAINAAAGVIHAAMQQGKTLPQTIAYALDSAGLLNSPETAAELEHLRKLPAERAADHRTWQHDLAQLREARAEVERLRVRVAELEAQVPYREVWSSELPPGGLVCSVCGQPVESEPCPAHAPQGTADEDPIRFALTAEAEALHASSGAAIETPAPDGVRPQVAKLRALLAGQREDVHDSELHHPYRLGRDLPSPEVQS